MILETKSEWNQTRKYSLMQKYVFVTFQMAQRGVLLFNSLIEEILSFDIHNYLPILKIF